MSFVSRKRNKMIKKRRKYREFAAGDCRVSSHRIGHEKNYVINEFSFYRLTIRCFSISDSNRYVLLLV